jgi:eukaryotic-like serine/threonine-protein kinase
MEFRILGPLEALDGGRPLPLGGLKPRALLALLLLNANEPVAADRLIDELWDGTPPRTAAKSLQVYVSGLRKLLPSGMLVTRPSGYELRLDPDGVDLARFDALVSAARGAPPAVAAEKLGAALSLWRGPPLADFRYEAWAQAEIARLEESRLAAVEDRIDAELALGNHAGLVGELDAILARHPLRERLRAQHVIALYRSGRQADALGAYQEARRVLVEELGIEPSRELRELHQAVLRQDPSLDLRRAAEPVTGTAGVFVGREVELAELRAALETALAGSGRLILLAGEPGIGKSRLAEELVRASRGTGVRLLTGRCWEAGGAPAYWPWTQSLRTYVRELDAETLQAQLGAGASEVAQIVPELRDILPGLSGPRSVDSEDARFRLFDATTEFLRRASETQPLVLVLDDLHAADAPSLLLLRFLARDLGSARILVVGAYRDVSPAPGEALSELLADLAHEPVTRRLSLRGLGHQDVAEYIRLTASEIASEELVNALAEGTEGNPLFVGEFVRLLSTEGVRPSSPSEMRIAIPQSVRDVIERRLTYLSAECKGSLVRASVLGREFGLEALARLSGVSTDELVDTLDEAVAARVVTDVPGGADRMRFAHVLIRDTLYEGLTAARRARFHREAVRGLEALYGEDPGPHLAELAHHSIAGASFDEGLRYAWRAADQALLLLAYEEAARLYETAIDALARISPSDESARCRLLLSLGEAEGLAGNADAAKRAFLDAAEGARRLGLTRELGQAAAGYGGRVAFGRAGDDSLLVPLLEEGLAALPEEAVALRARLLARLAGALRDEHSRERRDALSREAVELARRTGDMAALAYALDGRVSAIVAPDTVAECLALATELRQVAERLGDKERLLVAHSHQLMARLLVGDLRGAEEDLDAATLIARELKQPAQLWRVGGERAMLALAAGRLSEAAELVEEALSLGEHAQRDQAIPVYHLQRYTLGDFRGTPGEVEPAIRKLIGAYPARAVFRCALARLVAQLGRHDEAKRAFDELAEDDFSALPFDQEWLYGMSLLAETSTLLGDAVAGASLYRLLLPYAALNAVDVTEGFAGSISRYLGLLAALMSRFDDAARHFEEALAMNETTGARPWLAHTQHDFARTLQARNGAGDRERARELLALALATYRELGMETYAARAHALAAESGAST